MGYYIFLAATAAFASAVTQLAIGGSIWMVLGAGLFGFVVMGLVILIILAIKFAVLKIAAKFFARTWNR